MGGGTALEVGQSRLSQGLSPRGRGNPVRLGSSYPRWRSIPAWAGEPLVDHRHDLEGVVYPRVGGGTDPGGRAVWSWGGLSPRGRGNQAPARGPQGPRRSIPAWAGEPRRPTWRTAMSTVYPRVGGGTPVTLGARSRASGLSPRGRGNPTTARQAASGSRSIPAWAGEPV